VCVFVCVCVCVCVCVITRFVDFDIRRLSEEYGNTNLSR